MVPLDPEGDLQFLKVLELPRYTELTELCCFVDVGDLEVLKLPEVYNGTIDFKSSESF